MKEQRVQDRTGCCKAEDQALGMCSCRWLGLSGRALQVQTRSQPCKAWVDTPSLQVIGEERPCNQNSGREDPDRSQEVQSLAGSSWGTEVLRGQRYRAPSTQKGRKWF